MDPHRRNRIIFLTALSLLTAWLCYLMAKPYLKAIFFAIIISIVFYPLNASLQKKIRNHNLSALISTLSVLLVIIIPSVLLGSAIRRELAEIYQSLNAQSAQGGGWTQYLLAIVGRIPDWLGKYIDLSQYDIKANLADRIQQASSFLLRNIAGIVGDVVSVIVDSAIVFFTLFFLFRDGRSVYRRLAVLAPLRPDQVDKLAGEISKAVTASLYGGLAVAAAQGLLTGLAFWFLKLPSPALWGMAAAIFSFVPLIGSAIIWAPAAVILLLSGHWIKGLILLGWGSAVVGMADNIIRPYVISEQVKFHPLYVFFALLGGVQAFGLLGIFVGPVVVAIAQALFGLIREEAAGSR